MLYAHLNEVDCVHKIIPVVFQRLPHRFVHNDERSHVDYRIKFLTFKNSIKQFAVAKITFYEPAVKQCPFVAEGEIVICNDVMPLFPEGLNNMTAYVSRAAGNENFHVQWFIIMLESPKIKNEKEQGSPFHFSSLI
jgi:hypothetical protein